MANSYFYVIYFSESSGVVANILSSVTSEIGVSVTTAVLSTVGGAIVATMLSYVMKYAGLKLHRLVNEGNFIM